VIAAPPRGARARAISVCRGSIVYFSPSDNRKAAWRIRATIEARHSLVQSMRDKAGGIA
jgi:hypothetical protein